MGILERLGLKSRPQSAPDVSHFESVGARIADPDIFDLAQMRAVRGVGVTDSNQPSQSLVRTMLRSTFARCVQIRADAIAQAMLGVHGSAGAQVVRRVSGGVAEVEESHPWVQLLRQPNEHRSAYEVWMWASMARDLQGSADFIVVHDSRGVPIALQEVFSEFGTIKPVPDSRGGVEGYIFWRRDGVRIDLEPRDVIRFRRADPTTPWQSVSLLEWAAYNLDVDLYASIYQRDQLKEGRFPPAYLSSEQRITESMAKEYGQRLKSEYMTAGSHTQSGALVIGSGLEIKTTPLSADDLALIDSRKLNDTHIFWATGVPQGLLSDDANRANAEAARATFERLTVQPETVAMCSQLSIAFERSFGAARGVLQVVPPKVVSVDPLQQARVDEIRIRSGTTLVNEARERDGLDKVEGGDVPLVSAGLAPLVDAGFSEPSPAEADGEGEDDEADSDEARDIRVGKSVKLTRMLVRAIEERDLDAEWRAVDRKKRRRERPIQAVARDLFEDQATEVAEKLREFRSVRADKILTVDEIYDLAKWIEETVARLGAPIMQAIQGGFETGVIRAGIEGVDFSTDHPDVIRVLDDLNSRLKEVPRYTRDLLNGVILDGMQNGSSTDAIATEIASLFDGMKISRARTIARTSGTAAFERGQQVAFKDGGVETRGWLTQRDGRARETHDEADGQVVGIDEPFEVGSAFLDHPGDPTGPAEEIINCRCTQLPERVSDE